MTPIETECRWSIAAAYIVWAYLHGTRPLNMIAYLRRIGLDL
jgi:hypothetical protein